MAEVWLCPLWRSSDESFGDGVWDATSNNIKDGAANARTLGAEPLLRLESIENARTAVEIEATLRDLKPRRLRHLMVILLLSKPGSGDSSWSKGLVRLVTLFPEVCFRFVTSSDVDPNSAYAHLYKSASKDLRDLGNVIVSFLVGYREWFDPLGVRRFYRSRDLWKKKNGLPDSLPPAFILEDEREYAELLAYVAYRTGRYAPEIVAREKLFENRFTLEHQDTLVVHAMDLPFNPFDITASDKKARLDELRKVWCDKWKITYSLEECKGSGWRMAVSGGREEGYELVPPSKWPDRDDRFAWKEGTPNHKLRGLNKPLPWIPGLLAKGIYPAVKDQGEKGLDFTFFDGRFPLGPKQGHSAPDQAQAIAEALLERARGCLNDYLPVMAAVLALDAIRTLRGRSATLFVDALTLLHRAEVHVELEVTSAAAGNPARETRMRAAEVRKLLHRLDAASRLPRGMEVASRERLWTTLRQTFLEAGAFDAADEALMEVHRARAQRWRESGWRKRALSKVKSFYARARSKLKNHAPFFDWLLEAVRGSRWDERYLAMVFILAFSGLFLPFHSEGWRQNGCFSMFIAVVTGVSLVSAFVSQPDRTGWVAPAVRMRSWLRTAFLSVLILTIANMALFCRPDELSTSPGLYGRVERLFTSFIWTCGSTIGSETLPRDMLQGVGSAHICFPNAGGSASHCTFGHSLLWIEGVITGWVLFAFGLSAIYRKAVRS